MEEKQLQYGYARKDSHPYYQSSLLDARTKVREINARLLREGKSPDYAVYRREWVIGSWEPVRDESELVEKVETATTHSEDFWMGYGCEEKPLKTPILFGFWEEEGCYGPGFDK